jgi:hypothetical protein
LDVDVISDTTSIFIGDTLALDVTSTEPLRQLFIVFSQLTEQDTFYRQYSVPITDESDSTSFDLEVPLPGFPTGQIKATVSGEDLAGNSDTLSFSFTLRARALLEPEKAFAAPNPAGNQLGIYLTPGEDITAELSVYTIDGQEVWRPEPVEVSGGERYMFDTDVSNWPVGLYLFIARVEHADGRRAEVKKTFAVIR